MINKKNYWLFSIVLLAAAESTYDAWGCKKFKDCCCGKLCNDKKNSSINPSDNNNSDNPDFQASKTTP